MEEDNIKNNETGCDQFTRPEEILELQKYLRALREDLNERTHLETGAVKMDPSYRENNIQLDSRLPSAGRVGTNMNPYPDITSMPDAVLGIPLEGSVRQPELSNDLEKTNAEGFKNIDKLPDTIDTISVERIERLEQVREKLLGADTNSPRELDSHLEGLSIPQKEISLGDELIRLSKGREEEIELPTGRENLTVPSKIDSLPTDSIKMGGQLSILTLGKDLDRIAGETKEVELSEERLDLNITSEIDSLPTDSIKMGGKHVSPTLGEERDRIPFLETSEDQLPDTKESIGPDQRTDREEIKLGEEREDIPKDQGMMFDSSKENLPDAVLGIPGKTEEVSLDNTLLSTPIERDVNLSLPDVVEEMPGKINPVSLSDEIENIPKDKERLISLPGDSEGIPNNQGGTVNSLSDFVEKLEGEFSSLNELPDELQKDGRTPNINGNSISLAETLPEGGEIPTTQGGQVDSLEEFLSRDNLIPGNLLEDSLKLSQELPKDGYTKGEFDKISELTEELQKDGRTKGEFRDVTELTEKLPKKDGYTRGEFKDVDGLAEKLPKKDGYTRGEFEKINRLADKLPKKDGYTRGDFKDVKGLANQLPEDGYPSGSFKEVERLAKKLPEGGYVDGDFKDLDELTNELPLDGVLDGDFTDLNELPNELPLDGHTGGDFTEIKKLPNELPLDGHTEGDLKEIDKLTKKLPEDGKTEGDFKAPEIADELPEGGHTEGDFKGIWELTKDLPEGGHTEGDFKKIGVLADELPRDGIPGGDFTKIKKLPDLLPSDGYTEGDLKDINSLEKRLPKDGHTEGDFKELEKLTKVLPDDGHTEGDFKELEELVKKLPEDGKTGGDFREVDKLTKKLPEDGKTRGDFKELEGLTKVLPDDGHTGGDFKTLDDLANKLPKDGIPGGDFVDIDGLYGTLPFDGHTGGDFKDLDELTKELPEGGKTEGDFLDINELTRDLPADGHTGGDFKDLDELTKVLSDDGITSGDFKDFNELTRILPKDGISKGDFKNISGLTRILPDDGITGGNFKGIQELTRDLPEDSLIAKDTFPSPDPDGPEGLSLRNPLELDNKKLDEIDGRIHKGTGPDDKFQEEIETESRFNEYTNQYYFDPEVDPNDPNSINYTEKRFPIKDGIVAKNSRNLKDEEDIYEKLQSLELIDPGVKSLYHALTARAAHDLDGYYTYVGHYSESKDLSSGWGQKLMMELGKLGGDISIDDYKNFDANLSSMVMKYYEDKGAFKIEQSHIPQGLDAFLNVNSYLRYVADLARLGYNKALGYDPKDPNKTPNKAQKVLGEIGGILGLKENMIDRILIQLVQARDISERLSDSNRDRLPGNTGILQDFLMNMDVGEALESMGKTFMDKLKSNNRGQEHGDTTVPINRPTIDPDSKGTEFRQTKTTGWYDPHARSERVSGKSGFDLLKSALRDTFSKNGQKENYSFSKNYLTGSGIKLTLLDLDEKGLSDLKGIESVEGFMKIISRSPLITSPSKFLTTSFGDRTATSLDTNNYWEVVVEPYLGLDNGFCSYLPCIDEINILNYYTHGVRTYYSRWLPIVSFDLSRSRTVAKSIGLFGGEFTIPGGVEYSNEFRMTLMDDSYKSWRRYFEKCADVGVYNSKIHPKEFYGYYESTDEWPSTTRAEIWKNDKTYYSGDSEKITVVDKSSFVLAPYKNVTFRIRIYIMTPQYSTINKYDLLATLKEVSIERSGEIESGAQDLELTFSIVGETNEDYLKLPTSRVDYDEIKERKADPDPIFQNPEEMIKNKKEEKTEEAPKKPNQPYEEHFRNSRVIFETIPQMPWNVPPISSSIPGVSI